MRILKLLTLAVALGVAFYGCRKEKSDAKTDKVVQPEQAGREAAMGTTIQWLGHASFRISHGNTIIYIDPWKLKSAQHDATLVLVSHSHYDHYSAEDIAKVSGPDTKLAASADVIAKEKAGEALVPGLTVELEGVRIVAVPAYNPKKEFHPKANNWVGFVIELGSQRIYYAGDTDLTEEMRSLTDINVALLPVGGKYTMNAAEAAEAANQIRPDQAIPCHWGDIVGSRDNAEQFAKLASCKTRLLMPGETVGL